ncbi:MAG: hypothetical protein VX823_01780 [Actinomycetota bacterium]|nr:hypothetical protein [Actinomycetota bacterium]
MDDTQNGEEAANHLALNWSLRKGVASTVTLVVVLLLGLIIWVASASRGSPRPTTFPAGLLAVVPEEGDQAPRQGPVGVSLSPGWRPTLTINDVTIPDDQLNAGTRQLGEYFFSPAPGRAISEMRAGQICAHVVAVPTIDVEVDNIDYSWCWTSF